jgi:hypothetical protein
MDRAKAAADLREQWRYWKYLDEQVQQAAERYRSGIAATVDSLVKPLAQPVEDLNSEWTQVKLVLARTLSPAGYANWIKPTCQVATCDTKLIVWLPDEATREYLETDYSQCISEALARLGPFTVEYTCKFPRAAVSQPVC